MAFLDDIAARLVAQGAGTLGTDIFISTKAIIPTGSGPYILLVETGGTGPAMTHDNTATERPTAQLSCRATSAQTARTKLKLAYDALGGANGLHNVALSGTAYLKVTPRQSITDIGLDGAGRAFLAFNIEAEKQPS